MWFEKCQTRKEGTNNSQDMLSHLYDTLKCDAHFFFILPSYFKIFSNLYLIQNFQI